METLKKTLAIISIFFVLPTLLILMIAFFIHRTELTSLDRYLNDSHNLKRITGIWEINNSDDNGLSRLLFYEFNQNGQFLSYRDDGVVIKRGRWILAFKGNAPCMECGYELQLISESKVEIFYPVSFSDNYLILRISNNSNDKYELQFNRIDQDQSGQEIIRDLKSFWTKIVKNDINWAFFGD